jgi:hypothetical protein
MFVIAFNDVRRATLPVRSGNVGWIGVSPDGTDYHVVVPVDIQIARGVMACNRPDDGTPFGGYSGWLYFECAPYEDDGKDNPDLREQRARQTALQIVAWLKSYDIEVICEPEGSRIDADARIPDRVSPSGEGKIGSDHRHNSKASLPRRPREPAPHCSVCGKSWRNLGALIGDPLVKLRRYRACLESFQEGVYLFGHSCGGVVEVPVSRFARSRLAGRSLIGSHACPGLCYYETSLRDCSAECEGSCYRRIAGKLENRGPRSR